MTYIVIDTETTALLAPGAAGQDQQPHMIEFAGIKLDENFKTIDIINLILKPKVKIADEITKITGYTDELVKDKKPFIFHWKELAKFFSGCDTMIGHNLMFDKEVLRWELFRINKHYNFPWCVNDICTVEETQKLYGHRLSLTDLHIKILGTAFEGAHGALADAMATMRCFVKLKESKNGIA